jgi:hypothetical protein
MTKPRGKGQRERLPSESVLNLYQLESKNQIVPKDCELNILQSYIENPFRHSLNVSGTHREFARRRFDGVSGRWRAGVTRLPANPRRHRHWAGRGR